jgi:lipopolysaccharide export LptBFGC system permease protein LptF
LRLQRYILQELLVAFAFAVGGMMVLALPAIAVAAVSRLSGVDTQAILYFVPLLLAGLVPYIVPLGFLLAAVVTYGRLAADKEWTAAIMSGRNPYSLLLPGVVVALGASISTLWLVSEVLPAIRRTQSEYQVAALRSTLTNLGPGRTELHLGRFYIAAGFRDGPDFMNAMIYLPGQRGESARTVLADRVHFQIADRSMYVHLKNPRIVRGQLDVRGGDPIVRLDLDDFQNEGPRQFASMRYQKTTDLMAGLARGDFDEDPPRKRLVIYEIHQRCATSSTCFLFLLLGVPTGLLLRKGTQLSALATAVGYALLYYLLSMRLSKQLAFGHFLSPQMGAWAISILGAVFGLWLMRRAMRR